MFSSIRETIYEHRARIRGTVWTVLVLGVAVNLLSSLGRGLTLMSALVPVAVVAGWTCSS